MKTFILGDCSNVTCTRNATCYAIFTETECICDHGFYEDYATMTCILLTIKHIKVFRVCIINSSYDSTILSNSLWL